jgi:DNA polymerase-3 subunit gamma/tau
VNYQVLARKYRPTSFAQLKGQSSLVTTLTHAIKNNKVAHAFLLTGVRGIGKTTTARIIAKTINCTDLQINDDAVEACDKCPNCLAFIGEHHPDVIEVDAASKTGINDIREIIENANYAPILAQYKVYIIDEIHMLSTSAFNALLKTLEEPPGHVKFIFATTEVKKLPLTIISRCQRFDLRRFNVDELVAHLQYICREEKIEIEDSALKLIALHSDGSVRDSLSLLDQVILHAKNQGRIDESQVQNLLGITGMILIYQLFDLIISGKTERAILFANDLYHKGSEPLSMLEDLLAACNIISKAQIITDFLNNNSQLSDSECLLVKDLAKKIDKRDLAILWQMFLKGFEEVSKSNNSIQALEMIIIRICCLADMPSLEEVISGQAHVVTPKPKLEVGDVMVEFKKIADMFLEHKEMILHSQLKSDIAVLAFEPERIEVRLIDNLPKDFAAKVISKLNDWTDQNWQFIIATGAKEGGQTLAEYEEMVLLNKKDQLSKTDIVDGILKAFPGATIDNIIKTQ